MTQSVVILGRQPALGLAELESLYGSDRLMPLGRHAVLIDLEPIQIDFSRLGGTVKFCKLLTRLDTTDWNKIVQFLNSAIPKHLDYLPEGKMRLGLSLYGFGINIKQINASALGLKKVIRENGRSVRVIPNNEPALSSAQVLHNQLTGVLGWDLIFIKHGGKTIVAQNIAEQDINAYAARDQKRPKRDARVGMLPPKLAQIIVNLASGPSDLNDPACGPGEPKGKTILDPFCGTGVLLQEALLMGYNVYGTDLEPRMIDYTTQNLEWLKQNWQMVSDFFLSVADATTHKWQSFNTLATETYLGRPFSVLPDPSVLDKVIRDVDTIHKKFLQNIARQTKTGFKLCLAVPAWKTRGSFKHLPILDHLEELGYTRTVFVHAGQRDLIYHREEQIVGRELVVLVRK